MQKIIVDTNVIVSSLITRSYPLLVVEEIFKSRDIIFCVSDKLVREYQEVLRRGKFSKYPDFTLRSENLLIDIERKGVFFSPKITLNVIGDLPDNRLLELAVESDADFLITGNSNDFSFPNYGKTKIVNPKDYWELHK